MEGLAMSEPKRQEIDHHTIKLIVGIVALSLATLTSLFAKTPISSISASYYEGGWSQSIFIGFLFAISSFLVAYNGFTNGEMLLSKVAAAAALGVALFPCECGIHKPPVPYIHGASAAAMFLILAYFCLGFYRRARGKHHTEADRRALVYGVCGLLIVASIGVLALDHFLHGAISAHVPRLVFFGEATALMAFGISWLTASRVLPFLTNQEERIHPLDGVIPPRSGSQRTGQAA
jgi:hypothetical protein